MPTDPLEGQNLGKYRVLEPLGRGGMARVYRAYHPQLDRYVAIKVLRSDLVEEEEFLARFKREARAVAALRHPNVVQVFDFDVRGDLYYMVMELLEGDTLRRRLNDYRARDERMPLGDVVRILLDVLDGLAYAHSEGMIHRDVKPANVLLTRRGQAVLTDFGIAQIVGGTHYTVSGALMGTLAYMAPEQGLEGQCDVRSDLYSLGIIFYEMLTGEPPFDAETPLAILMKHVNDPLPLPRKVEPSVPKWIERVVLKVLAKRPNDRYQSAEEMAEALRQAAAKAKVELPAHISLPLSFSTAESPSESVAVLSGTAREKVVNAEFSTEDTDATLGQRLADEAAAAQGGAPDLAQQAAASRDLAQQVAREPGLAAVRAEAEAQAQASPLSRWAARRAEKRAERAARRAEKQAREAAKRTQKEEERAERAARRVRRAESEERGRLARSILMGLSLVAMTNLVAVMLGLFTQRWGIFGRGWPFELLLAGVVLCLITEITGSVWMLIPTCIVVGNGFLLSFYALTDWWKAWAFLWPMEPLLIVSAVMLALWLSGQGEQGRQLSRNVARLLSRLAIVLIPIVILVGMLIG